MDGAIGAILFLAVMVLFFGICYRNREALGDWLEGFESDTHDARLKELRKQSAKARSELRQYERRLKLQKRIVDSTEELEEMDKADTKEV